MNIHLCAQITTTVSAIIQRKYLKCWQIVVILSKSSTIIYAGRQRPPMAWRSTSLFRGIAIRNGRYSERRTVHKPLFCKLTDQEDVGSANTTITSSTINQAIKSEKKHRVKWHTANLGVVEFDALDGETIRTAAMRSAKVSPHNGRANLINCRGLGTCGTCAVAITPTATTRNISISPDDEAIDCVEPRERNVIETLRLAMPPGHGPKSAAVTPLLLLACQVQIRGNLSVTKYNGFWGQNIHQVADHSTPSKRLGSWEFVLDS